MKKSFILFLLWLIVVTGLVRAEDKEPNDPKGEKPLIIALVPEQNIFEQIERYTPLVDYLSGKVGRRMKLKVMPRYGGVIDALASSEVDGSFLGSLAYAVARLKINVEVLARPEDPDGSSTCHGILFVRKESGIKRVADMKGKRFAFVDEATFAGFLFPVVYFHQHGVRNYKAYLKEVYFAGTHEDTIYDVLNGKADIGVAKNTVFKRAAKRDARIGRELMILTRSPDVPETALAVRKSVDPSVRKVLEEALLKMHEDAAGQAVLKSFGVRKFILTTDKDYAPVYQYARTINLNLAEYGYLKD